MGYDKDQNKINNKKLNIHIQDKIKATKMVALNILNYFPGSGPSKGLFFPSLFFVRCASSIGFSKLF